MKLAELTEEQVIGLEITEEDIKEGVPANCWYCPTALALLRLFGMQESASNRVSVGQKTATVEDGNPRTEWALLYLDDALQKQIMRFDSKKKMDAGTYKVTVKRTGTGSFTGRGK